MANRYVTGKAELEFNDQRDDERHSPQIMMELDTWPALPSFDLPKVALRRAFHTIPPIREGRRVVSPVVLPSEQVTRFNLKVKN